MTHVNEYDVIIVGGSYAGLAAGMALGRALRNVLIIDNGKPCNRQTPHSHNFLTNDGKTPHEISGIAKEQVSRYASVNFLDAFVSGATKVQNTFEIQTGQNHTFKARKLIFATGITDMMPNIPGFSECWGISVLHCPYCHGYEVRHEQTGILANGDTGFEMASLLNNWTRHLTLYTDGASTLNEQQTKKLKHHNISVVENEIDHIEHDSGHIRSIVFNNGAKAPLKALYTRLPFVQHSQVPGHMGCELTKEGHIKIDAAQKTTVHGVFACGDNTSSMRTVANAVSMGTTTGFMVNRELIEETF